MDSNRYIIACLFEDYKRRKNTNELYSADLTIPKTIINLYTKLVEKPSFENIITRYKNNYINCESSVEPNFSQAELKGLSDVYDYILNFDFEKTKFNIFLVSLNIHQRLYKHCGDGSFGGRLRESTAVLQGCNIDIVTPDEAKREFNGYILKGDSILNKQREGDIFGYIEDCIRLNVDLIKLQPFYDGNKRTFRSLMNLLLKPLNIPPIYIEKEERKEYKNALIKAMRDNDLSHIIGFYYYKICDAIVTADIKNSLVSQNEVAPVKQKTYTQKKYTE